MENPFQLFTEIYNMIPDKVKGKDKVAKFVEESKYISPELSADIYHKFLTFLENDFLPINHVLQIRADWMFKILALFSRKSVHQVKHIFYESTQFYGKDVVTEEEFNIKYSPFLGYRHYGLDIHGEEEIVKYLDSIMQTLIQVENFEYFQIKLKFNTCRFYVSDNISHRLCISIENHVNKILKNKKEAIG